MNIFTRRELTISRDLSHMNNVVAYLGKHHIVCHVHTNTITNTGRSHGIPNIKASAAYEYRIYVHKSDYVRAISLMKKY